MKDSVSYSCIGFYNDNVTLVWHKCILEEHLSPQVWQVFSKLITAGSQMGELGWLYCVSLSNKEGFVYFLAYHGYLG